MENKEEKLTEEELLEWLDAWRDSYNETIDEEAKVEYGEECEQAYNQILGYVKEHFRNSDVWDGLLMSSYEKGLRDAQQNAKPKVSRENIKRFAMTKLEDEHHYEENAEAIACWLNALGWEVVEK